MSDALNPASAAEAVEAVRATRRLLAVGAGTKPPLSAVDCVKMSTQKLTGMIEYEPSEFTFTALAGTPISEIISALAKQGQYLPFDPLLIRAGATLGGTVAAGLNGPGRFRFGGLRDFILGVKFVDGLGRLLRLGGKVVKNAAGFDVPKFMVGSLGRFGVLTEITFKVFPRPPAALTLKIEVEGVESASRVMIELANSRWQPDAIDLLPDGKSLCLRLAGPAEPLEQISREILNRWRGEVLSKEAAEVLWDELREFSWAYPDSPLIKVPLTPVALNELAKAIQDSDGARVHVSGGGNVAFISLPAAVAAFEERLRELHLSGLSLRGAGPLWLGSNRQFEIEQAVKKALDPHGRFPRLGE